MFVWIRFLIRADDSFQMKFNLHQSFSTSDVRYSGSLKNFAQYTNLVPDFLYHLYLLCATTPINDGGEEWQFGART